MTTRRLVTFLLVTSFLLPSRAGKNPCHPAEARAPSETCTVITLPQNMCGTCGINGAIDPSTGNFMDCTRTSGLYHNHETCLSKLQDYVDLNPCDTPTRAALEVYRSPSLFYKDEFDASRQRLDYFIYTMCEQACDCIPQVGWEDTATRVIDVFRGNCPAHAYFDVCRLFPNIRLIRGKDDVGINLGSSLPPAICPYFTDWLENSGDGNNFLHVVHTTLAPEINTFLQHMLNATGLVSSSNTTEELSNSTADDSSSSFWGQCLYLEATQNRINGSFVVTRPPTPPIDDSIPTKEECKDRCLPFFFFLRKRYWVHVVRSSGRCRLRCALRWRAKKLTSEEGYKCGRCP